MRSKFPFPFSYLINAMINKKHISLVLYGRKGAGKSRTALILAYNILYYARNKKLPKTIEDYQDWELWNKLIARYIVFTPKQLINRLKGRKTIKPVLIIDDANIMFNSSLYREDSELYFSLIGLFATIRTKVANLILTAVDPQELIKPIRQMQSWFGYVWSDKEKVRVRVYEVVSSPVKPYMRKIGYFEWKQELLPKKAYQEYEVVRWLIGEKALERVERVLAKRKNKEKEENNS